MLGAGIWLKTPQYQMIITGSIVNNMRHAMRNMPLPLLALILLISGAGFVTLYSAAGGEINTWAMPQIVRFIIGFVGMIIIAAIPIQFWLRYAYLIYAAVLVLLVIVEIMGHIGMGAQRWINLGFITIQPSELAKIATILALARHLHNFPPLKNGRIFHLIIPAIITLIPVSLILKQPNLGTATLLCGIVAWVMFAAGLHRKYFIIAVVLVACAAPIAWQSLHDYQKRRVATFLSPDTDPLGAGYNISQSIIAISSGEITGKGLMQGSQTQLNFLPEKQTDFIFSVLAEEFGFVGSFTLILGYSCMILIIIGIAYHSASLFGTLVAQGVAAMLCLHMLINIGMVMGMLPVVGIPLPLVSYGGSNMISILGAFGLAINVWVHRSEKLPQSNF
jgi:rod shape determining protein RodA